MKKLALSLVAAVALATSSTSAFAQNQLPGSGPSPVNTLFEKKTPAEFVGMLTAKGLNASLAQQQNGSSIIIIQEGESAFYVRPIGCDANDSSGSCYGIETYAFVPSNGLSPDRLNQLNLNHRFVSGQFLEQRLLIKRAAIFNGGVTESHFFSNIAVFIGDLNQMVSTVQKSTTLVQHDPSEKAKAMPATFTPDIVAAATELDALKKYSMLVDGTPFKARMISAEFTMPKGLSAYLPE